MRNGANLWAAAGAVILAAFCLPGLGLGENAEIWHQDSRHLNDPIAIKADLLELRRLDNLVVYKGDVVASQQEYHLYCNQLELHWDPEKRQVSQVVARGDVRLETRDGYVTSGMAVLDMPSKVIVMSDSPRLVRGGESVEGEQVIYSISNRKSSVLGGKGKRVKTRLIPKGQP